MERGEKGAIASSSFNLWLRDWLVLTWALMAHVGLHQFQPCILWADWTTPMEAGTAPAAMAQTAWRAVDDGLAWANDSDCRHIHNSIRIKPNKTSLPTYVMHSDRPLRLNSKTASNCLYR